MCDQFNCGGSFTCPVLYKCHFLAKFSNINVSLACRREKKETSIKKKGLTLALLLRKYILKGNTNVVEVLEQDELYYVQVSRKSLANFLFLMDGLKKYYF